jgi:hypothetical protein
MADEDEAYKRSAEVVYNQLRHAHEFSLRTLTEYGKWLISSLLFLHGAAIGGLLFKWSGTGPPPYLASLWWFVLGVVFALGAGLSAWWNFTLAAEQYERWADHRMLNDRTYWPTPKSNSWIDGTRWCAVGAGIGGAACVAATWN